MSPNIHLPSSDSFNLSDVLRNCEIPGLLNETMSLDSISTTSLDSVPDFPPGCMIPMQKFVGLNSTSKLKSITNVTITSPTPPRLRTMLKEILSIAKWAESLPSSPAPGHIPWENGMEKEGVSWTPEGSMYSPSEFRDTLARTRPPKIVKTHAIPESDSPAQQSNPSFRDALVFEREITLKGESGTKRWSVQVPAAGMNKEMVDMMLELQGLNAFFRGADELEKTSIASVELHSCTLTPPTVVISDPLVALPFSLATSGKTVNNMESSSLAARRGKQVPPRLASPNQLQDEPYPDIPTAFLGSSDVTPKFDAPRPYAAAMNLDDMVGSLRSQCAFLQPKDKGLAQDALLTSSTPPADTDDAFTKTMNHQRDQQDVTSPLNSPTAFLDSPLSGRDSPNLQDSDNGPASPALSSISSCLSSSPRGILKRCKSVRFLNIPADQVERPVPTVTITASSPTATTHSVNSVSSTIKRPSPLRHTFAPKCNVIPPSSVVSITSKTAPYIPVGSSLRSADRQKALSLPQKPHASTPTRIALSSNASITPKERSSTLPRTFLQKLPKESPSAPSSLPQRGSLGRNSLSRVMTMKRFSSATKENPKTSTASRARYTVDENSFRRDIVDSQKTPSRMPVPLKNIFRFK